MRTFSGVAGFLLLTATLHAQQAADLIKRGDAFDVKLQEAEALKCYLPAEKLEPNNPDLLVRIARQYRHLVTDAGSREDKLKFGRTALEYSKRAATLAPSNSETQLSVAISYAKLLPVQGKSEQAKSTPYIKDAVDKAIKLDPRNDLAWHVLGRWHRVLADLGGIKRGLAQLLYGKLPQTTNEEAVKCFNKAIELNPTRLRHYIELGRTYAQMGRNADARRLIEQGLAMPNVEKDDPETKRVGRETLAKLR